MRTVYAIEDGIPIPPKCANNRTDYPFEDMKVGQSFKFEGTDQDAHRVRSAAHNWGSKRGVLFTMRKLRRVSETEAEFRIWREV